LQRGRRVGRAKARGIIRRRYRQSFDAGSFDCCCRDPIETPIDQAGGHGGGRNDSRAYEVPTIEVNGGVGYLTGGYFIRLFQRINNESIEAHMPTEFQGQSLDLASASERDSFTIFALDGFKCSATKFLPLRRGE
jgi:hypothetical protein